jgi:hypothetical protein
VNFKVLLVASVIFLTACDAKQLETLSTEVAGQHPAIYLGAGIRLQVSDSNVATVFGYDECPSTGSWLFARKPITNGCVRLTGNDSVKVRLINSDGSVTIHKWTVAGNIEKVTITTESGFQVREPDLANS